jgi:hypothetical protein
VGCPAVVARRCQPVVPLTHTVKGAD